MQASNSFSSALYQHLEEYADITPIYPVDPPNNFLKIDFDREYLDAFSYLRAVMANNEMSVRAYELTAHCLRLNAAHYSIWQYRREIIEKLQLDLGKELEFLTDIIYENPKNYQVWHHRRVIVQWLNDPSEECNFVSSILHDEDKNYHAWQYRQWLLREFAEFYQARLDDELVFINVMLARDPRNNSAWNHRVFVRSLAKDDDQFPVSKEYELCRGFIEKLPTNESVWSYLSELPDPMYSKLMFNPEVVDWARKLHKSLNKSATAQVLLLLVEIEFENIRKLTPGGPRDCAERVFQLLKEIEEVDPIRQQYYRYRKAQAESLIKMATDPTAS